MCTQGHKLREVPPYADVRAVAVELRAARLPERQRLAALSTLPQLPSPGLVAAPAAPTRAESAAESHHLEASQGGPAQTHGAAMKLDTWLMPEMGQPGDMRSSEASAASAAAPSGLAAGQVIAHWLDGAVRRQRTAPALCLRLA